MWIYEKKLQYPVRIKNPNPALAKLIISQYGGPHGELGASLRYLSQRYSMPYPELRAILTDIGISVSEMQFYRTHAYLVEHTNAPVRRDLMDEIDWNDRLIGIKGTRGRFN